MSYQTKESAKNPFMNTAALADLLLVKPNTIRRAFCIQGAYLDLKPIKLSTGRLMWPSKDEVLKVLGAKG